MNIIYYISIYIITWNGTIVVVNPHSGADLSFTGVL